MSKEFVLRNGLIDPSNVTRKELAECCANLMNKAAHNLSKTIIDRENTTKDNINIEITYQMMAVSDLLQYMVNSTSWQRGRYFDFDKEEILQRIERLKFYSR